VTEIEEFYSPGEQKLAGKCFHLGGVTAKEDTAGVRFFKITVRKRALNEK
jgi:hypothetical protein